MGIYAEYLDRKLNFQDLQVERRAQLKRISDLRGGRGIIAFCANITLRLPEIPIYINPEDQLPFSDQLSNLNGDKIDLLIETPGGIGETAENIIRQVRDRFTDVGVIVPGMAMSAGTIMTMAGDEILMGPESALGPIDAQLNWQGKVFSAGELLDGIDMIKKETEKGGGLNRAYVPILQNISPGELQRATNAQSFSQELVRGWLAQYKFKDWHTHSSSGQLVTAEEKQQRAKEIAKELCNHRRWLTHGRQIKLADLRAMRLLITDYSETPDLADAIRRYYALLKITFDAGAYKVYETPTSQIYKFFAPPPPPPMPQQGQNAFGLLNIECNQCKQPIELQINFEPVPLKPGAIMFPGDSKLTCPNCGVVHDLAPLRNQVELQEKRPIIS